MQNTEKRRPRPGHLRAVESPQREELSPAARRFLWIFSVTLVLVAGTAFVFKLLEFFFTATTQGPQALASFLIPVLNYLLVAAGFFCLFLWAYSTGQFRDMEAAKYRMLELQREIDRAEAQGGTP
jgi:nitrogen fixation-related uncharacterized protein